MLKSLQEVIDNPLSELLTFEVFMENFDEVIPQSVKLAPRKWPLGHMETGLARILISSP